jgi:(R)-2-hydroxyacyl-CoA dehydratese activating ATPase
MQRIAGIDVGTGFTKAVLLGLTQPGAQPAVLGRGYVRTGVDLEKAANQALEIALGEARQPLESISYIVTTGFGRYSVSFRDIQVTEITSGARGARHLFPGAMAVLDIGSQSTRAIALNEAGKVAHFKTNDKCAAGSGSFIVRAAKYLQLDLENVGEIALKARNPQPISSVCAVLGESEIINHVSAGISVEDILCGIYDSLADRAALLLRRAGTGAGLVFIGGVARQKGMVRSLENRLKVEVSVPDHCEYVSALGAALLGSTRLQLGSGSQRDAACPQDVSNAAAIRSDKT